MWNDPMAMVVGPEAAALAGAWLIIASLADGAAGALLATGTGVADAPADEHAVIASAAMARKTRELRNERRCMVDLLLSGRPRACAGRVTRLRRGGDETMTVA